MKPRGIMVALVVSLAPLSALAATPCETVTECESDEVCWSGRCAAASAVRPSSRCQDEFDCKRGQVCAVGRCRTPDPDVRGGADRDQTGRRDPKASEPELERNTGLLVGGILCSAIGAGALLSGLALAVLSSSESAQVCDNGACRPATEDERSAWHGTALGLAVGGSALVLLGTPLIAVGIQRRPVRGNRTAAAVVLGPTTAALRVQF
jgi:hypothetical protein